jgi:hypothetical protein
LSVKPVTTMSERLWDLDWSKELPWAIGEISVEHGTYTDALDFMKEHYARIFATEQDRFFVEQNKTDAKRRFGEEMDVFLFRLAGKVMGICCAHPTDWATYYFRTFAILPELRERRFASEFATLVDASLRAVGLDRWEAEVSVANQPMMKLFVSLGALLTSTVSTERWGMMCRFTTFLNDDAEAVFRRQFVSAPNYGRNEQPNERRTP